MNAALLRQLRRRDQYCLHCGETDDLVPHHRRNRQMGGSKQLDRLDNLLLICADYNGRMESSAFIAEQARELGHKLNSWDNFDTPVFDECNGTWYLLDEKGGKSETTPPDPVIF